MNLRNVHNQTVAFRTKFRLRLIINLNQLNLKILGISTNILTFRELL